MFVIWTKMQLSFVTLNPSTMMILMRLLLPYTGKTEINFC